MDLTRQLLAFSRCQVMELQPVSLSAIVDGLRKLLRTLLSEDIDLQFKLDESLGHVMADRGQIEQVIMNLVVNARDAMPRGGKIVIETSNVQLDESCEQKHKAEDKIVPGPYVMLSISDTGVGMTEEVRERAFDPFFTTKDKDKGTGLGLSMVYGIVKQSGGQIFLHSEPGMGSTFKIYLPRTDAGPEIGAEDSKSIPLTGDEIILLVEDDHSMRKAAGRILVRHGYRIIEASNPKEALEKFEKDGEVIQLLLTDIIMPGGNGRELAEKLRVKKPNLKVLFMSGYTDQIISENGLLEGGFNLIMKPFHAEHFLRQIRQILDTPIKH